MRKLGYAIVLAAGLGGPVIGCGMSVSCSDGKNAAAGLTLADSVSGARFVLSVADGSAELTAAGVADGAAAADPELADTETGELHFLTVRNGALTLVQAPDGVTGAAQIGFVDTVTKKTYALAVVRGTLTLIPD